VRVDLRSDTVTQPTAAMRRAMADAEVGDDQYGEDPTVNALQESFAQRVGKAAALFVPSGTMANQLAVRVLTRPGDGLAAGARSHLVAYEDGAASANSGVSLISLDDTTGLLGSDAVTGAIAASAHHQPRVALVAIEDTHMASGGVVWPMAGLAALAETATRRGAAVHLDGARLWHAEVAGPGTMAERASGAITVMCCLSKALGAPVGSLLAGPADVIAAARVERHRMGGAMRQAGVIAAAGRVAMDQMVSRLAEDHARAARLADALWQRWPDAVRYGGTNIVVFLHRDSDAFLNHLRAQGVLAGTIAPNAVRLVTHLDVDDAGIEQACKAIASAP
jgi:threonine aldolase